MTAPWLQRSWIAPLISRATSRSGDTTDQAIDDAEDPPEVRAPAGKPARIVFTRMTDGGCGQQVVFPDLNIRKDLPLKEAVPIAMAAFAGSGGCET